ncbi:MAG: hypothetical protein FGM14_06990 [Flavobacteriales bacterium]|nr:hypothetical protein [Flavobacteriales bacterium]
MTNLKIFEKASIRSFFDKETENWYFSIVDVVEVLTDSVNPTDYLKKLRKRDVELGVYLGTNCPQIAMVNKSGIKRKTLAGTNKDILRLIQSIPSPKAEPFKQWLAQVGAERIAEIENPELAQARIRATYKAKGMNIILTLNLAS